MSTLKCYISDTRVTIEEAFSKPVFDTLNNVIDQQTKYIDSKWLFYTDQDTLRGTVKLVEVDWKNAHAKLEISWETDVIAEASQAIRWMSETLFSKVSLNRLHAQVEHGSMLEQALSNAGYKREVLLRRHAFIDGEYKNISWMGINRDSVKQQ